MTYTWRNLADSTSDKIFALIGRLILGIAILILAGFIIRFIFGLPGSVFDPALIVIVGVQTYFIYLLQNQHKTQTKMFKEMFEQINIQNPNTTPISKKPTKAEGMIVKYQNKK